MSAWGERGNGGGGSDGGVERDRDLLAALALVSEPAVIDTNSDRAELQALRGAAPTRRSATLHASASSEGRRDAAPAKRRTYHRDEVAVLRATVAALTDRLRILKLHADRKETEPSSEAKTSAKRPVDRMLSVAWEEVVAQQYALRREAEMENARLRAMLDEQIRFGRSFTRVLNKPIDSELLHVPATARRRPRHHVTPSAWDTTQAFDELMAQLPQLHAQTERVFDSPLFSSGETSFRKAQVKEDATSCMYIDMTEASEAPFDLETMSEEVWGMYTTHPGAPTPVHEQDTFITDDTARLQLVLRGRCAGTTCEFLLQIASARFVERDRVVIVWSGQITPINTSNDGLDGICLHHKGWKVIEPISPDELGDPAATATRVRARTLSIPTFDGSVVEVKRKIGGLVNYVLTTLGAQFKSNNEMLENRLIARSARNKRA